MAIKDRLPVLGVLKDLLQILIMFRPEHGVHTVRVTLGIKRNHSYNKLLVHVLRLIVLVVFVTHDTLVRRAYEWVRVELHRSVVPVWWLHKRSLRWIVRIHRISNLLWI